ncbi:MAG TPA: 5-oxoprolinase subunit PxpA [Opitutus sp.]|nr:5-oxoprolinase subunit PxpA [Opitutus sp.]
MRRIDLNCDLGEGAGHDAELMPLVTSANIACGMHAGDATMMRETVALAQKHGVAIGAHPGFADREHFGRHEMKLGAAGLIDLVARQIEALQRIAAVRHVKPHGALYNLAARDAETATAVATAVRQSGAELILFALAGSELARVGRTMGLRVAEEVFADRTYDRDGRLTPRTNANALIEAETAAVAQVLDVVGEGVVRATDGTRVAINADTVCLHGDGAHAVAFARRLRAELRVGGIEVKSFGAG